MNNYKFITPVSMEVTKEQFKNDLKIPLLDLGYDIHNNLATDCIILCNNYNGWEAHVGFTSISCINTQHRYYIDHYNPELFLGLAAMTDQMNPIPGEYIIGICDSWPYGYTTKKDVIYKVKHSVKTTQNNYGCETIDGHNTSSYHVKKATKQTLINHFTKSTTMSNNNTKTSRFPFKLLPEDAKRIIKIACEDWQNQLITKEQWGYKIILDKDIIIDETFYKTMRKACTPEQHELFDDIFGKDCKDNNAFVNKFAWNELTEISGKLFGNTGTLQMGVNATYDLDRPDLEGRSLYIDDKYKAILHECKGNGTIIEIIKK